MAKKTADKKPDSLDGPGFGPPLPVEPHHSKVWKILGVIGVILLVVATFIAYHLYQNKVKAERAFQADQVTFAQVEADMDNAYQAIVDKVGKPDSTKITKNCSHVSQVIGQGDLYCGIYYTFAYKQDDYKTAYEQADQVQLTAFKTGLYQWTQNSLTVTSKNTANGPQDGYIIHLYPKMQLNCRLEFDFGESSNLEGFEQLNGSKAGLYYFNCDKHVEEPHFRVSD